MMIAEQMITEKLTKEQKMKAERYIRENGVKSKYMTRDEMSKETGLSDAECKAIMKQLEEDGLIRMEYAIYCPSCGKITDKGYLNHEIHLSGYTCPWCGECVNFEKANLGKLYAPKDIAAMRAWKGFNT